LKGDKNRSAEFIGRSQIEEKKFHCCNQTMSKPIRIITLDLLRKRSEHNEGLVSSLEELALHQEELQSIGPILGRTCGKTLKILLLQNNVINRMVPSELKLFRSLEYLNLALNNISMIEGLKNMEWLKKLDLTLNFINLDVLEKSINELVECRSLVELFLLGNPCMGLNADDLAVDNASKEEGVDKAQKQVGWKGCRAYIIARLPSLQFLDGKEIKRSERILAIQQLPALTDELHTLAEEVRQKHQIDIVQDADDNERSSEYIADDATTEHNPATRTKMSNELYDQKQAKEKEQNANAPPKPKGEKEWEEEHADMVQKVREKEEQSREVKKSNAEDETGNITKKDGGIKQCNQGKYQFWFEEEAPTNKDSNGKRGGTSLIMRVAIPKYLSTSLIDVDIHPTYVSVVIKSKILRVILPVEVLSSQAVARRSQASGYLELVMPKADPNEVVIGLLHVRDNTSNNRKAMKELDGVCNTSSTAKGLTCNTGKTTTLKKKERLGESIMKEVGVAESLKIVQRKVADGSAKSNNDDDDDDEPPPLF